LVEGEKISTIYLDDRTETPRRNRVDHQLTDAENLFERLTASGGTRIDRRRLEERLGREPVGVIAVLALS
jgi:hypothetical protein